MTKKPTVTIGIPAHNEEKNIGFLLDSILKQKRESYILEKIIVICDGCTDKTENIIDLFKKKNSLINLISYKKREGKAQRLNELYQLNKSDLLVTIDSDLSLDRSIEIENLILPLLKNNKLNIVAGRLVPSESNSIIGRINRVYFMLWYEITSRVNNGNHIHNLHGSISALRKKFAESIKYPKGTISDQGYLYYQAIKINIDCFYLAKNTSFKFKIPETLLDTRIQGTRAIFSDKDNLETYLGKKAKEIYRIPLKNKIIGFCIMFIREPFYTLLAFLMALYVRIFPYQDALTKRGMWKRINAINIYLL